VRIARPMAVDVSSGVERAPGEKDPAKIRTFVVTARDVDNALSDKAVKRA
jgi:phosphoribosylanthranilate isomerase